MNCSIMRRLIVGLIPAVALSLSGCVGDPKLAHAEVSSLPLSIELPRVVLVSTTSELAAAPRSTFSAIRVGPHGDVLMAEMPGEGGILRIVDSTGHMRLSFGRQGEGPGEARGPLPLAITDTSVLAFDLGTLRLSQWDPQGHILGMLSSDMMVVPLAQALDGRWIAAGTSSSMAPVALDQHTLLSRRLLSPNDTFYRRLRPPPDDPHSKLPPVLGVWQQGFIVANGATYQLGLYDWKGQLRHVLSRSLPANAPTVQYVSNQVDQVRASQGANGSRRAPAELERIRSRAAHTPRDWFSHVSPLGLDQRGRIWVAGPEGDSAYVDVFNPERFLGRIHLPCRDFTNRWAMQGHWLAMVCAPDDEAFQGDAVVKLFRLEEAR